MLVIEHDLDLMAEADWIIDLGPEGGDGGGEIVAEGPPEAVVQVARSHTGRILGEFLAAGGAGRAEGPCPSRQGLGESPTIGSGAPRLDERS